MTQFLNVKTTSDRERVVEAIERLEAGQFKKGFRIASDLEKEIMDGRDPSADGEEISKYFLKLKERLLKMPIFSITLAFEPNEDFISKMLSFVRENFEASAVLDITVDKKVLGGAIVSYNGKYGDFSVRKKLEERLSKLPITNF